MKVRKKQQDTVTLGAAVAAAFARCWRGTTANAACASFWGLGSSCAVHHHLRWHRGRAGRHHSAARRPAGSATPRSLGWGRRGRCDGGASTPPSRWVTMPPRQAGSATPRWRWARTPRRSSPTGRQPGRRHRGQRPRRASGTGRWPAVCSTGRSTSVATTTPSRPAPSDHGSICRIRTALNVGGNRVINIGQRNYRYRSGWPAQRCHQHRQRQPRCRWRLLSNVLHVGNDNDGLPPVWVRKTWWWATATSPRPRATWSWPPRSATTTRTRSSVPNQPRARVRSRRT